MISTEQIRTKMRISHPRLDGDISSNIEAARLDMGRAGVSLEKDDALTDKAVELYCKAQMDYLDKGEQFRERYEALRDAMSMSGEYGEHGEE